MITIIHGTDTASSRKYFLDLKQKEPDQTLIDGKTVTLTDLVQIFGGGELFSEKKKFFIEDFFAKKSIGPKGKNTELNAMVKYIGKIESGNEIYLWEKSELTKANLNSFISPTIKQFSLPQSLFLFLDNIKPGNGKELIKLFHETLQTADAEMVFFMIVRQVRVLLALSSGFPRPLGGEGQGEGEIEEVKRMSPWQKTKLQKQADFFEIEELKELYRKLFEIEKAMKTGNLSTPLAQTIDFLLLAI